MLKMDMLGAGRELGEVIKELRGSRKQKEMARRAGVSEGTWRNWEKGKQQLRWKNQLGLARALDCSLEEIADRIVQRRQLQRDRRSAYARAELVREDRYPLPGKELPPEIRHRQETIRQHRRQIHYYERLIEQEREEITAYLALRRSG